MKCVLCGSAAFQVYLTTQFSDLSRVVGFRIWKCRGYKIVIFLSGILFNLT